VPIIASAVGGIPEAVEDGVTGLLVPPADVPALGAALTRLLADPDLRRRLGAAGRERVQRLFDPAVMVAGNLAVYREVLAGRPATADQAR
jgi:glycosyltransferase involved in cell wall biosynthesis